MPSSGWSQFAASQSRTLPIPVQPRSATCSPTAVAGEDAVHRLAVDVELQLVGGAVADPHRARAAVARPVLEHLLLEIARPVDPVHDVERAARAAGMLADPIAQPHPELLRLLDEPDAQQRAHRERGIADPGVAVVPVALAADLLGQRRRRRRDQPPGRGVRHQLEGDRRAVHHLAPAPTVGRLAPATSCQNATVSSNSRHTSAGRTSRGGPSAALSSITPRT